MGWLIRVCIQKPVLCLAGGVKVHLSLGRFWMCQHWPVNFSCEACLWLLACRHHRAVWFYTQDPPPNFLQKHLSATYTPSSSGVAVLAWARQSTDTALSWWNNKRGGLRRNQWQQVTDALSQQGAGMTGAQFKAPELQVGHCSHQCLASNAKSWQARESECWSLESAFLSLGTLQKGYGDWRWNNAPVAACGQGAPW